jgi:hypothetical protein
MIQVILIYTPSQMFFTIKGSPGIIELLQEKTISYRIYRVLLVKLNLCMFENCSVKQFSNMHKLIVELKTLYGKGEKYDFES